MATRSAPPIRQRDLISGSCVRRSSRSSFTRVTLPPGAIGRPRGGRQTALSKRPYDDRMAVRRPHGRPRTPLVKSRVSASRSKRVLAKNFGGRGRGGVSQAKPTAAPTAELRTLRKRGSPSQAVTRATGLAADILCHGPSPLSRRRLLPMSGNNPSGHPGRRSPVALSMGWRGVRRGKSFCSLDRPWVGARISRVG